MPTPRRTFRINNAIHSRQLDIIAALDGVHDQHNLSAVLRTADAAGFGKVLWYPDYRKPEKVNPEVSKGSERWVELKTVDALVPELKDLKKAGFKIAATHMGSAAVDFRTIDWCQSWVVVFGNEHRGCSDETLEIADENIFIPMYGFVQSLNISVAAAVTLFEIQRQRQEAGWYDRVASESQVEKLFDQWGLAEDHFVVGDLKDRIEGSLPAMDHPHTDGRFLRGLPENFAGVQKKQKKS